MKHDEGYVVNRLGTVHEYQKLSCQTELCLLALAEVYILIGPWKLYTIHAGKYSFETAVTIQRELSAKSINNPLRQ